MRHTALLNNKVYLTLTTAISIAVLSGVDYSSLALAVLLIAPIVKLLIKNPISKQPLHPNNMSCR